MFGFLENPEDLTLTCWYDDGNCVRRLVHFEQVIGKSRIAVCGHGINDRRDVADGFRTKVENSLYHLRYVLGCKDIEIQ